jgi:hypothetical protein
MRRERVGRIACLPISDPNATENDMPTAFLGRYILPPRLGGTPGLIQLGTRSRATALAPW